MSTLCLYQVCLEGAISCSSVIKSLSQGKRAAGDLIPWTISQQVSTLHQLHHKCWLRWPANKSFFAVCRPQLCWSVRCKDSTYSDPP